MSEEFDVSDQEYMSDNYEGEEFALGMDAFGRVGPEQNEDFAPIWIRWRNLKEKLRLGEFGSTIQKDLQNIQNIRGKNPTALVASYYCLDNGKISEKKFKKVCKEIKEIKPPDLLRYCRLWLK